MICCGELDVVAILGRSRPGHGTGDKDCGSAHQRIPSSTSLLLRATLP
jgi:hypothetical protein